MSKQSKNPYYRNIVQATHKCNKCNVAVPITTGKCTVCDSKSHLIELCEADRICNTVNCPYFLISCNEDDLKANWQALVRKPHAVMTSAGFKNHGKLKIVGNCPSCNGLLKTICLDCKLIYCARTKQIHKQKCNGLFAMYLNMQALNQLPASAPEKPVGNKHGNDTTWGSYQPLDVGECETVQIQVESDRGRDRFTCDYSQKNTTVVTVPSEFVILCKNLYNISLHVRVVIEASRQLLFDGTVEAKQLDPMLMRIQLTKEQVSNAIICKQKQQALQQQQEQQEQQQQQLMKQPQQNQQETVVTPQVAEEPIEIAVEFWNNDYEMPLIEYIRFKAKVDFSGSSCMVM